MNQSLMFSGLVQSKFNLSFSNWAKNYSNLGVFLMNLDGV